MQFSPSDIRTMIANAKDSYRRDHMSDVRKASTEQLTDAIAALTSRIEALEKYIARTSKGPTLPPPHPVIHMEGFYTTPLMHSDTFTISGN